ncbi:helix-turn-helix domain-containing protein [Knoellia locipacati]|uniref:helix-turn-helix domain-containing protein n=1 Tax=Knoellia locipacati TaxID=882824 RepID=UPI00384E7ED5
MPPETEPTPAPEPETEPTPATTLSSVSRTSSTTTARDILRLARRQQRLTQAELAERAGVSQNVVARYESCRQQPTVAALERLVAVCGYTLEWTLRHAPDTALETARDGRFSGPIGRRLIRELDTVLAALDALGATDARVYGGVADGSEGVGCPVLIGVNLPLDVDQMALSVMSGHLGLAIDAHVTVVPHSRVAAYGYDDEGVLLTPMPEAS